MRCPNLEGVRLGGNRKAGLLETRDIKRSQGDERKIGEERKIARRCLGVSPSLIAFGV